MFFLPLAAPATLKGVSALTVIPWSLSSFFSVLLFDLLRILDSAVQGIRHAFHGVSVLWTNHRHFWSLTIGQFSEMLCNATATSVFSRLLLILVQVTK